MTPAPLSIIYEDNHLLVLDKPAGLATMGAAEDEPSLWREACLDLKRRFDKPGKVYLGVVSRLDKLVSGVIVFARTSKAAARLSEQIRARTVEKTYWAIVAGLVAPQSGAWHDWLSPDTEGYGSQISRAGAPQAVEARLGYRVLQSGSGQSLLEIDLETGRKHQIRIQAASRGHAVFGDRRYGSRRSFPFGIALHSRRLRILHPTRKEPLEFVAEVPEYWSC